jgi:hypothetical protein
MSPESNELGYSDMVCLGSKRSWSAVKAELYRQQLVHKQTATAAVAAASVAA